MTVNLGKAWKKLLSMALLLMVLAMALPASLSAGAEEDGFLGDDYRIDPGQYDISFLSDINMYEVKERDGSLSFYVLPVSGSEIRISGAEFRDLMPQLQGISQNGITYGTEIHEAGDFLCIPFTTDAPVMHGVMAAGSRGFLYVYFEQPESQDDCLRMLSAAREIGTADGSESGNESTSGSGTGQEAVGLVSAGDLPGYYDCELLGERDTDIVLILTPGGHGRMSNSTSSVNFDYELSGGRILMKTNEISLTPVGEGRILFHSDYTDVTFVRRPDVSGAWDLTGDWHLTEMSRNGVHYSSSTLKMIGVSIDFTAYADGTVDWHAVSDSASHLAQGWGIDENGLYFHNGNRVPCTLEGDRLTMQPEPSGSLVFVREAGTGPANRQETQTDQTQSGQSETPEGKKPDNPQLPRVTDFISAEMTDWKKEVDGTTTHYTITFATPPSDEEIAAYAAAITEQMPMLVVAQGLEDDSGEIVSVIRHQYAFMYDGETNVEQAETHLVGSYQWKMGDRNTRASMKMVAVQGVKSSVHMISLYVGDGLIYDDAEEERLSAEAIAARPTPRPTATPVPETERTGVRLPWVTDYVSAPLSRWEDMGIYSDHGRHLLLQFSEPFDEEELESYIRTLSSNKNFTLIAHGVSDRREEAGILTDVYDFRYNGPETILTIWCDPGMGTETEWILGEWNHETNLVVYVIRNSAAHVWGISLYLSPDMTYDAEEANRVVLSEP